MEAMGIIFSNIYDSKMGDLTWERTSGSIPFGGRYRQIKSERVFCRTG